ncbi:trigger factor [Mycolicibacterium smegmatis]|uniref:Trigger factor n=3 Tax=Bacteria TaxID=2 RepID=TIG_MYCS2|nr:trigger factor [Mycolicibacterium smegmatis]A0R199.1 RecName: Full=Trigger factor; Short=TF; AltName: Full=PPIase [Mycolicibacterium smegmatis MC2 155]ABK73897.1 trigger factor [Mycolicibacterium smegmatis MC2 155]AFP41011.1 Trigger factor [Mycolicibacterium smegmatis MC2 155]AIU09733.1 trigger factor [Mycolicibacterium smegmatis MC2 155]AIU16358.1 trigger factor [Mycolicibacterium smegmatis]AIU22981.1 trigger factor [Mycolicibacterium smegmatis]
MKSTVEQLSPTRVRINVEVPFTELEPDFDRAFKELAKQVRLPGFRPGKAPRKLLEARIGRGAVLEQVVNDALPSRYSEAVSTSDLKPLGQPEIEITKLEDNEELVFTAEVDIRPEITLPELESLKITVDPIEVTDEEVDAELQSLRARFGTLKGVERGVQEGDFVSIDLSATVDGNEVPEAATEGLSHEVGSGQLIDGLDEAIIGLKADESKTFTTKLVAGEYAGQDAEVTVTVKSVKERELPEPDDEFAQLASEYDTIEELRNSLVDQVRRLKSVQQAEQIRDKAIEALLEQTEVPLPEKIVQAQIDEVVHNAIHGLDHDEEKFAEQLAEQGSSREEFDAETRTEAEKAVKTQLLMDAVADKLEIQVSQNDLTERLVLMSRQYGLEPQQLIQILQQNNQLPAMFADVRRGLTIAAVVHAATVTDTDGNVIDTMEFFGPSGEQAAEDSAEESTDAAEGEAAEDADDTDK